MTAIKVRVGEELHGVLGLLLGHVLDKGESSVGSVELLGQAQGLDLAKGGEQLVQLALRALEGEVLDEQLGGGLHLGELLDCGTLGGRGVAGLLGHQLHHQGVVVQRLAVEQPEDAHAVVGGLELDEALTQ